MLGARPTDRDWSHLMAPTQDGDRAAYRTLLEEMAPYLRVLAARRFKEPGDIDDAVQDVLLTVHAWGIPTIRAVRSDPGLLLLPTDALSIDCGGTCGPGHAKLNLRPNTKPFRPSNEPPFEH